MRGKSLNRHSISHLKISPESTLILPLIKSIMNLTEIHHCKIGGFGDEFEKESSRSRAAHRAMFTQHEVKQPLTKIMLLNFTRLPTLLFGPKHETKTKIRSQKSQQHYLPFKNSRTRIKSRTEFTTTDIEIHPTSRTFVLRWKLAFSMIPAHA